MNELVSALRQFIARDVMYVLGGSYVLLSAAMVYHGDLSRIQDPGGASVALWVGTAYVLGFGVQETLSLTRLITTQPVASPGRFVAKAYRLFTGTECLAVRVEDWAVAIAEFESKSTERVYQNYQRLLSLKHIGTAVGSNLLASSILLGIAALKSLSLVSFYASALAALLAAALLVSGWVKGAQQVRTVMAWKKLLDGP